MKPKRVERKPAWVDDLLKAYPRCDTREMSAINDEVFRQCIKDAGHTGKCELGPWRTK